MTRGSALIVERLNVHTGSPDDQVRARIEFPGPGVKLEHGMLVLAGWALGSEASVTSVEVVSRDGVVGRIETGDERPDLAAAFPSHPRSGSSGFFGRLDLRDFDAGDLMVRAVLSNGVRAGIATLRLRPADLLDSSVIQAPPSSGYDLRSADALDRYKSSPAMRWAGLIRERPPLGSAWERITSHEFFEPLVAAEFAMSTRDSVFAMGSCFARNVEGALAALGVDVVSRTSAFDDIPIRATGWPLDFTNKYNTEAIRNELRWALDPKASFPAQGLLRLPEGVFQDPFASPILEYADEATTLARHLALTDLTRQIPRCRIIVITLGLIEAFFDTATGLYTNTTPHLTVDPERFRFRVLSFDQILSGLEDVHELLTRYGHPEVEIVVTVSPVPLEATFTGQDVVLANTLSKATLRTAAGTWAQRHENVHYFPSYEIVVNSDRSVVWEPDGRHVRPAFVRQVMDLFLRTHVAAEEFDMPPLAAAAG